MYTGNIDYDPSCRDTVFLGSWSPEIASQCPSFWFLGGSACYASPFELLPTFFLLLLRHVCVDGRKLCADRGGVRFLPIPVACDDFPRVPLVRGSVDLLVDCPRKGPV